MPYLSSSIAEIASVPRDHPAVSSTSAVNSESLLRSGPSSAGTLRRTSKGHSLLPDRKAASASS